jgi:hypothetical protein
MSDSEVVIILKSFLTLLYPLSSSFSTIIFYFFSPCLNEQHLQQSTVVKKLVACGADHCIRNKLGNSLQDMVGIKNHHRQ